MPLSTSDPLLQNSKYVGEFVIVCNKTYLKILYYLYSYARGQISRGKDYGREYTAQQVKNEISTLHMNILNQGYRILFPKQYMVLFWRSTSWSSVYNEKAVFPWMLMFVFYK